MQLPPDEMQIRFERDETIFFVSSSGHCNLDCSYCVVNPIVKHQPSLSYDDLRFVLDQVAGRVFFIFSGKGDFFAGYRRDERLLARLLEEPRVGVALDVNGVVIHCFESLSPEQLSRVRHVNLTFHYRQLANHKALQVWRRNALTMLRRADGPDFFLNLILSPPESHLWAEALDWYAANIHAESGKKLILIHDVERAFGAAEQAVEADLLARHGAMIQSVRRGQFADAFLDFDHVDCQAGVKYFRLWNDGRIDACPNVGELQAIGDAKARRFTPRQGPFRCRTVTFCDCYHVATAGHMVFHKRAVAA